MSRPLSYEELVRQGTEEERAYVRVERREDRATITLEDPGKLNVLSAPLMVQLRRQTEALAADPEIRSIVITGSGKAFSAGGDLRMMDNAVQRFHEPDDEDGATAPWRWIRYQFGAMVRTITRTDKLFIAAINGPAAGVGLAFALNCDVAVASQRAVLVPAFGRLGLIPEVGTSWALTRRLGYQRALQFYVAGRHIEADEALELGLVQEVVSADGLLAAAQRWCDHAAELPAHALAISKPLLRAAADAPWEGAVTMEEFAEPMCFTTRDFARSVDSLLGEY
ncbi:MAG: enoyl-CoA hydratase/isomerase family protein [Solirubrobacterales bacterium]